MSHLLMQSLEEEKAVLVKRWWGSECPLSEEGVGNKEHRLGWET